MGHPKLVRYWICGAVERAFTLSLLALPAFLALTVFHLRRLSTVLDHSDHRSTNHTVIDVFVFDASISISSFLRLRVLLNFAAIRMVNRRQTTKAKNPVTGSSANSLL